jgi:hypothetical protein
VRTLGSGEDKISDPISRLLLVQASSFRIPELLVRPVLGLSIDLLVSCLFEAFHVKPTTSLPLYPSWVRYLQHVKISVGNESSEILRL